MRLKNRLELARADDLTLGVFLERFGTVRGPRLLVDELGGVRLTFADAADLVERAAGSLHGRIRRGDRVLVATPNGYRLFLACLAVSRAGGIAVPVNPRMAVEEVEYVERDAQARVRIDDFDALSRGGVAGPAAPTTPDDVAVLLYTSGTTGRPKGAELTHRALLSGLSGGALVPDVVLGRGCATGLPVAHVAGLTLLLQLAALGVPVHLLTHFRPTDALDVIEQRRPAMFVGVPAMYRMMIDAGAQRRDLSSVRLWSSGADRLDNDIIEVFRQAGSVARLPFVHRALGRAWFVDGYGMVETGGGVAVRVFAPVRTPVDGLLRPIGGHRTRIVDDEGNDVAIGTVGELLVSGPGVMRGYHGVDHAEDSLTRAGWLRTGDLARPHRFGFFELAGRKKDVIKHGGYSVFAAEIERVLAEHPAVAEVAAVGLPDPQKGEIPAVVVRSRPGEALTPAAVLQLAAERLSDYKRPQRVAIVDELPRTGTDKIDKGRCRALFTTETNAGNGRGRERSVEPISDMRAGAIG
jgi:acyl-CoA synthetase (AMP-forming)/AMP-acid ligase II